MEEHKAHGRERVERAVVFVPGGEILQTPEAVVEQVLLRLLRQMTKWGTENRMEAQIREIRKGTTE